MRTFESWTAPRGCVRPSRATTLPTGSNPVGATTTPGTFPGAVFLDIQAEISDPDTRLRFMAPSAERFADAMGRLGVGDGARVVLYSAGSIMWATRVWWMLRAFGFDGAAVLDGGFEKWKAEGRPVTTAPGAYPAAVSRPVPGPDSSWTGTMFSTASTMMDPPP